LAIAIAVNVPPAPVARSVATAMPRTRRRCSIAVAPSSRRAIPKPAKRLVPNSASAHGYAASTDGKSVWAPRWTSWAETSVIDGTRSSSEPRPSQTIAANAR
jgi:hypothetical protein